MPSATNWERLVQEIAASAEIKKSFFKSIRRIPPDAILRILEDVLRFLNGNLPLGQAKSLAGYRLTYVQITSGAYRVVCRKNPSAILFAFHKNKQRQILNRLF